MSRSNQVYINQDNGEFVCRPCDRSFSTLNGALNHCQNAAVHSGEWCNRCERLFVSPAACAAHQATSHRHNICQHCDLDFCISDDLEDHEVNVHHRCTDCGLKFINDNNL
ncbi:hypothetical protein A1O3_04072 [Capronia epimyces CBS 606.96]|uniref:C2H2-type domain-containing protein n=1 Tax=Capronia epimyces CBS 606.96 TaxID=1182542 RepID=W9YXU0_9EURO|nr:uncharacterized protein A1O3_04072 [Capronia epimyces CBS 606.96]EXJ87114.1 hypothetical protein A1O3_04072 [Capronia epimyces CBS 606.96]